MAKHHIPGTTSLLAQLFVPSIPVTSEPTGISWIAGKRDVTALCRLATLYWKFKCSNQQREASGIAGESKSVSMHDFGTQKLARLFQPVAVENCWPTGPVHQSARQFFVWWPSYTGANLAISGRPFLSQTLADTFSELSMVVNARFAVGIVMLSAMVSAISVVPVSLAISGCRSLLQ